MAKLSKKHSQGCRDTGYRIGSGSTLARVYHKRFEIRHTHKGWFEDIWRMEDWDGRSDVTSVEFQIRRPCLLEYHVNSYADLTNRLGDMWSDLTEKWLVIKKANPGDSNHRRWPTSPLWEAAQSATGLFGGCLGMQRYKQKEAQI